MGLCTCSCGHRPEKYTNPDLVTLNIGDRKQSPKGCGPSIGGRQGGSCYDWCMDKGFKWPSNGEYDWGGQGDGCKLCSFDYGCNCSGKFGCCDLGGSKCTVKRTGYNGHPGACCLLGGTRQLTGIKYTDTSVDWSDIDDDTYTCNSKIYSPYQKDSTVNCATEVSKICSGQDAATWNEWDPKQNGLCVAWVNAAGSAHYSEATDVLQNSLQEFANASKTIDQPGSVAAQNYVGNVLEQCAKYPGACDSQLKQLCSTLTRDDVLDAYDGMANNQNNWNIVAACGCHLPDDQYTEYGQFGIDEKYYDSCDPLCKLNPAIPKATCDAEGKNCQPWPCEQTICIIDDVTVDVMNSNVPGGVNFNITCGGCDNSTGGCLCVFSDMTVFTEASHVGSIDFNMNCGGQCAVADPKRPGAYTNINCVTGKPTGGGGGGNGPYGPDGDKFWEWVNEHKKELLIGAGVVVLILAVILVAYLFSRERKSKVSLSPTGDAPQSISQYFSQYSE